MEDSAKRRERLQAMRMEAAAAAAPQSPYSSPPRREAPPLPSLLDPSIGLPPPSESTPTPRFDFYTDPLAAFSGNKRRRGGGLASGGYSPSSSLHTPPSSLPYAGPRNYPMASNHPLVHQYHMTQNPDYGSCETPSRAPFCDMWRSPVQLPTPFSSFTSSGGPGSWNRRSGASSGHDYTQSGMGGFTPQLGLGDSPVGYAGSGGSPYSHQGRGRGWPSRGSPSPQWSGGRGRGFYGNSSTYRETYYLKSMVKDPWRKLKPIVGNILEPLARGSDSRRAQGSDSGRARGSDSVIRLESKSSLAEILAASFESATED